MRFIGASLKRGSPVNKRAALGPILLFVVYWLIGNLIEAICLSLPGPTRRNTHWHSGHFAVISDRHSYPGYGRRPVPFLSVTTARPQALFKSQELCIQSL
jgi:hypothetical protein